MDIEPYRFDDLIEELLDKFGGVTVFEQPSFVVHGFWKFEGRTYEDKIMLCGVFTQSVNDARSYLEASKGKWKAVFKQEEILITESSLDVI